MALVHIASFANPVEAEIARGMLADHGIESVADGSTILSVMPMPEALGGVRLMVNSRDYDEALRLLEEHGDLDH